jgi:uncharacterized protein involved in outer membrane biogenesis
MEAFLSPLAARAGVLAKSRAARTLSWTLAGLLVIFALVGFFAVPPILKSKLEETLSQVLHRPVMVEAVRVNPFAPSVTVRGLSVRERTGDAAFIRFDEFYANAAWTSIFYLAPVVDEIRLVRPQLRLVRNADWTYNVSDLLDEFMARPKSDAPMPEFALFNIRIVDGRVDFDDRVESEKHEVSDLRVGIPFLSSLPAHAEVNVAPELSMMVNGALLSLTGEALPFQGTQAAVLNLDVHSVNLTRLTDYLPFQPRAKLADAVLDARITIAFEQSPGSGPVIKLRGSTAVRRLRVLDLQDRPAIAWKRLGIELNEVEPLTPRIDLKSVELEGADIHLRRDATGAINFTRLGPATAAVARAESRADPLSLKIDRIAAKLDRLRVTDETTKPAFDTVLAGELDVSGFDLQEGKRSEWTVALRSDLGETVKLAAGATAVPLAADGRVDLAGLVLKRYQPYVDQAAELRIDDGKLDLGLAFKLEKNDLSLADVALGLKSLRARLPDENEPFVRVGSLEMKGARLEAGVQTANLGEIAIADLTARLRRSKDGILNVARIAKADGSQKGKQPGRPWRIDLARATLRGAVTFEDLALGEPPAVISIAPLEARAEKLSTAKGASGSIDLRATIDKKGTLTASGPLTLDPLRARLNVAAQTIGLVPTQRYIDDKVHFAMTSGNLSAKGTASIELAPSGALNASYRGGIDLADFASIDKRSTNDLLKWKALSLAAIHFELEPLKLSVDDIALSDYYARIIVTADGNLNLQELVKEPEAPSQPAAAQAPGAPAPNLRIGKIMARDGNVNFSDLFIRPNFSANLTGFGGSVTEMTSEKAGDVELRGKIDNAAPVEIAGRVNPLGKDLFLDMKASARDIELAPLSAYSVKYAGYGIQRGKLSLALKYSIENGKLSAENQIYLDQLTFGERVESPTATKLPVTLAVALLKDRNGVIDVNLPISGSLDDPQFSVGGIILQVIGNLVVKAVTSPFALLGSLVGGGEELSFIEFAPGSAALAADEQQKLGKLAKALTERPNLRLEITGRAAAEPDQEALKRAALDAKVRAQKFEDLRRAGTAPASADAVSVEPAEYEKYLRRAYGAEKIPDKPRNFIGIAKEIPVPDMESLMLAHTSVGPDDLQRLANGRAQAAKEWLMAEGKVPAARLFINAPALAAPEKGKPTRADFGLK